MRTVERALDNTTDDGNGRTGRRDDGRTTGRRPGRSGTAFGQVGREGNQLLLGDGGVDQADERAVF